MKKNVEFKVMTSINDERYYEETSYHPSHFKHSLHIVKKFADTSFGSELV